MNRKSPVTIVHLALMILMLLYSGVLAVLLIGDLGLPSGGSSKTEMMLRGVFNLLTVMALFIGIWYVLDGYRKQAAVFYKAFLLSQVVETVLLAIIELVFAPKNLMLALVTVTLVFKAAILLLLVLLKNIGKMRTWLIYGMLFAVDVFGIVVIIISTGNGIIGFRIASCAARLVITGTIGIMIHGKYADKKQRGRG